MSWVELLSFILGALRVIYWDKRFLSLVIHGDTFAVGTEPEL
jgi:hypothetical protein